MFPEANGSHPDNSAPIGHYSPESLVTMLLMVITFILGIPGNILVIWVTGFKMKRTVNTVWFCNLAAADLTCCISLPFSLAHEILHKLWPYGPGFCKVLPSIIVLNMFASVFTLVAISVDRCILVVKPVWAQNHRSVRLAGLLCLVIWILSFVMCLPVFLYRQISHMDNETYCGYSLDESNSFYYEDYSYNRLNEYNDSTAWDAKPSPGYSTDYRDYYNGDGLTIGLRTPVTTIIINITRVVFGFCFPLLIIFICYVRLSWKVQSGRFADVGRKTRKVVIAIVLAFCVSWTPYHVIGIATLYSESPLVFRLDHLSQGLAYFNSCINPILYVFMGKDFKSKISKSVRALLESALSEEVTKTTEQTKSRDSGQSSTVI